MSYSAWFEGAALIQLNGLPPDAFDALVQRVAELAATEALIRPAARRDKPAPTTLRHQATSERAPP